MKEKIVAFFKSKGYIFIALICLAAVIAAGVSIINLSNEEANEPVIAYRTPEEGSSQPTATAKPAPTPQSTIASKPIDDSNNGKNDENTNTAPVKISISKPV